MQKYDQTLANKVKIYEDALAHQKDLFSEKIKKCENNLNN
jgi:hypothetical protein